MAETKRKRKQKQEMQEITPQELRMAKYVRWYTPKKSTTIQREEVDYFVGSKAIDTLLESKYGKKCKKENPRFKTREDCINFLQIMIDNQMLYRGEKVLKEKAESTKPGSSSGDDTANKKKKEESGDSKKSEEKENKKKKRRYMINYHDQQKMLDSNDIYVWVFDPVNPKKMFYGGLMLIGVVMATLFPLWPNFLRVGVYYLSVACGCFVAGVLLTGLLRSIFFSIVWFLTMGKYHIWFLPNLLADVGFFESFKPLYTVEIHTKETENSEEDEKTTNENTDQAQEEEKIEETEDVDDAVMVQPIPQDEVVVDAVDSDSQEEEGAELRKRTNVKKEEEEEDNDDKDGENDDSSEFEIICDIKSDNKKCD